MNPTGVRNPGLAVIVVVGVVVVLGGCSGAGAPAERVSAQSLRTTAAEHLSAVVLVKSWSTFLYPRTTDNGQGTGHWDIEFLPDGSVRMFGTHSDGTTFDYTTRPDGSGSGRQELAQGGDRVTRWEPEVWDGPKCSRRLEQDYPDGRRLRYSIAVDFGAEGTPQDWDGSFEHTTKG